MSVEQTWVFKVILAVDVFWCAVLFRDPCVTISSETGLQLRQPHPAMWSRILGWILNHLQANHCELAIQNDRARALAALQLLG